MAITSRWTGQAVMLPLWARRSQSKCIHIPEGKCRLQISSHGFYSISIDRGPKQYYNGFSDTLRNDAVLWASQGLPNGAHHVELRNENVYMQSDEVQAEERLCEWSRPGLRGSIWS